MFKKQIKIGNSHQMSSKDRKTFKKDLRKYFDKDAIDQLFQFVDLFTVNKVFNSKMTIYSDEENPIFVDSTSKKDYFPTVYALDLFPTILKNKLFMKQGVEGFIQKGAHLMWPGVDKINELDDFMADEVVSIYTSEGKLFAIGALAIGLQDLKLQIKPEGHAAYILHYRGDCLYQLGDQQEKEVYFDGKNVQVEKDEKVEKIEKEEKIQKNDDEEDDDMDDFANFGKKQNKKKVKTQNKNQQKNQTKKKKKGKKDYFESDEEQQKQQNYQKEDKKVKKEDDVDAQEKKNQDEWIMEAFLNAVILKLTDDNLPIENANFWNNYLIPCKNPDVVLDIKKSSHKKLGKLFFNLDKQGFIKYKETSKKQQTPQITQILRVNKKISEWQPTISLDDLKKDDEDKQDVQIKFVDTIKQYCVVPECYQKYLEPQPENSDSMLYSDWKKSVQKYFEKNDLITKDKIVITPEFKNEFNFNIEESDEEEDQQDENENQKKKKREKKKEDHFTTLQYLMEQMEKKMKFYFTYEQPRPELKEGFKLITVKSIFNGIQIIAEKQHNKFVTRVKNLVYYQIEKKDMMDILKKKFDTSVCIKDNELLIQGTFLEQLKDYLVYEMKFPEDKIELTDKVSKKKKEKNFNV